MPRHPFNAGRQYPGIDGRGFLGISGRGYFGTGGRHHLGIGGRLPSESAGYDLDDVRLDYIPAGLCDATRMVPVYEEMEGWSVSTQGARSWAELPAAATAYVRRIEQLAGVPIVLLGTSPQRDDTIVLQDPFAGQVRRMDTSF